MWAEFLSRIFLAGLVSQSDSFFSWWQQLPAFYGELGFEEFLDCKVLAPWNELDNLVAS